MIEIWKPISDYPSYEISSLGQIKNVRKQKIIRQYVSKGGYSIVTLYRKGYGLKTWLVHTLVAKTFLPDVSCCPHCGVRYEINHKDENIKNNSSSNLEYVTRAVNLEFSNEKRRRATKKWYKKTLWNVKKVTIL